MLLSLTDHDLGHFLEKHMAQHTFASRDPQRSQSTTGNVSHSLKFSLQASPQEVKLFCSALQLLMHLYPAISHGGTRQDPARLTPCFWPKNKGQANNTRLWQWVTHNQQNRCKGYILRDFGCLCSSPTAFSHRPFWKLYKPSAVTDQLPKLCFLNFSCYLWTAGSVKLPINSLQSNLANLRRVHVNLMAR